MLTIFILAFIIWFVAKAIGAAKPAPEPCQPVSETATMAAMPSCPFDNCTEWKPCSRANLTHRGGAIFVRQEFRCEQCGTQTRFGRYIDSPTWDFVTSVIG